LLPSGTALLCSLAEIRLEILAPVKDALDDHGVGRHHERDRRPPFEAYRPQTRQQIVTRGTPQWEYAQPLAEDDDTGI
jgi:hypothetical protein